MKTFEPLALNRAILEHNVNELETLLTSAAHLKERVI